MTTLLLIRHGQSTGNAQRVCCGQQNYPLTPLGEQQAALAGEYIKTHYRIDRVYSSPLSRAEETARPVAEAFDLPILFEAGLTELGGGVWEGQRAIEFEGDYAELYRRWIKVGDFCPEGGEMIGDFCKRVTSTMRELVERHKGECVAVFCHSGVINRNCRAWMEQNPALDPQEEIIIYRNGSITEVHFDDNGYPIELPLLGFADHLGKIATATPVGVV